MKSLMKFAKSVVLAAGVLGAASSAFATPIVGLANFGFGQVQVSLGKVDWNPPLNPGLHLVPTYGGFFTASGANTGVFAAGPFVGLTTGQVQDMDGINPADANYMPIGANTQANFLLFAAQPNWSFSMLQLAPGSLGSPFLLSQQGNNVGATISVNGIACDMGMTGSATVCDLADDKTNWTGIFSAQYTNTTIALIQATLLAGGTLDNNGWSATIEASAMPEPTSLLLVGAALLGVGGLARRKAAKSA